MSLLNRLKSISRERSCSLLDVVIEHRQRFLKRTALVFVNVGAFDGITGDPLAKYVVPQSWHGIFVEPNPASFERLRDNYRGQSGIQFENVAIGSLDGEIEFYDLTSLAGQELDITELALGLTSSTMPDRGWAGKYSSQVKPRLVPCLTYRSLLSRNSLSSVDILKVDTEGAEFSILKELDFRHDSPAVIYYEHRHLPQAERAALVELLIANDYLVDTEPSAADFDSIAVQRPWLLHVLRVGAADQVLAGGAALYW